MTLRLVLLGVIDMYEFIFILLVITGALVLAGLIEKGLIKLEEKIK